MENGKKQDAESSHAKTGEELDTNREHDTKDKKQNEQLTKEDLPDSTNESRGNMGSGQRQDSN